jgi:DNA-binding NarL/FixJ family response regulator
MKNLKVLFVSTNFLLFSLLQTLSIDDYIIDFERKKIDNICNGLKKDFNIYDVAIYDDNCLRNIKTFDVDKVFKMKMDGKNILLIGEREEFYIREMIGKGVRGIVSSNSPKESLVEAIRNVIGGKEYICYEVTKSLVSDIRYEELLTKTEIKIINYLNEGLGYRQIAEKVDRSPKTINKHIENIKNKLGVESIKELKQTLIK